MMKRGDIYWISLDPTKGSEIRKKRPCFLLGATAINQARRTVIAIPLSTSAKARPPIVISVACLNRKATIVCDQIRAVDKNRIGERIGSLSPEKLQELEQAMRQVLVL
jgi:mRNA interferase MazF